MTFVERHIYGHLERNQLYTSGLSDCQSVPLSRLSALRLLYKQNIKALVLVLPFFVLFSNTKSNCRDKHNQIKISNNDKPIIFSSAHLLLFPRLIIITQATKGSVESTIQTALNLTFIIVNIII